MRRPGGVVVVADSAAIGSSSALPGHHLDTARIHLGFPASLYACSPAARSCALAYFASAGSSAPPEPGAPSASAASSSWRA